MAKERRVRVANNLDLPVSVLKPFGTGIQCGKGSSALFSLSPRWISAIVSGVKLDTQLMDVVYTAYKVGCYEYESGNQEVEGSQGVEKVERETMFETYPFLWAILVLFYRKEALPTSTAASMILPILSSLSAKTKGPIKEEHCLLSSNFKSSIGIDWSN